ncbi:hypothetical protein [Enterobacter kobei]|uniref:hypothetical protein n=1 Tax=Enterobacter kobei TaxID=208224 RepID=UPI000798008A|nr:hypothetical protein [Enterobacter kobei]SAF46254.1 Uncharacterised protein [Enterobacter kobei]
MGGRDLNYQVVYRDGELERYIPGGWVFFQRPKHCVGYWLGHTYDDCFWFEFDKPVSLNDGIEYIIKYGAVQDRYLEFDDGFQLTP